MSNPLIFGTSSHRCRGRNPQIIQDTHNVNFYLFMATHYRGQNINIKQNKHKNKKSVIHSLLDLAAIDAGEEIHK